MISHNPYATNTDHHHPRCPPSSPLSPLRQHHPPQEPYKTGPWRSSSSPSPFYIVNNDKLLHAQGTVPHLIIAGSSRHSFVTCGEIHTTEMILWSMISGSCVSREKHVANERKYWMGYWFFSRFFILSLTYYNHLILKIVIMNEFPHFEVSIRFSRNFPEF